MSRLHAFVANQVLSRLCVLLGLFCTDFYSDIKDFTQTLCRYLPKKLAAKTSDCIYLSSAVGSGSISVLCTLYLCLMEASLLKKL